mmetsp:Transcript_68106/g.188486  ORF Transcript_68106/g.188486 Transcript_68106/m.188486 type:complete len:359 (+) Transcript_68106:141-1217(+)
MWQTLVPFITRVTSFSASPSLNCIFQMPRSAAADYAARAIPAPDSDGIALVFQDGGSISLQRFSRDCHFQGLPVEVYTSRDFWRQPSESGLASAVSLGRGTTAVVWALGGDIWVSVVKPLGNVSQAVRANGPERYSRTQARVVAGVAPQTGFFVAWSSWQQDGDGWGVFARQFTADGQAAGSEMQVNQEWRHFQWQPQLVWCADSLWALWANGTGLPCGDAGGPCATGPFLRRLAPQGGGKAAGAERGLGGKSPIAAALACGAPGGGVTALWLEAAGMLVWHRGGSRRRAPRSPRQAERRPGLAARQRGPAGDSEDRQVRCADSPAGGLRGRRPHGLPGAPHRRLRRTAPASGLGRHA